MYKHETSISIALLLISMTAISSLVTPSHGLEEADPRDPWFGEPLPPEPYPGFYEYLTHCIRRLTRECGQEVFEHLNGTGDVDEECCGKVLEMGDECNVQLATTLGKIEKFRHHSAAIESRSRAMFQQCKEDGTATD